MSAEPDWEARYTGRDPREAVASQVLRDHMHLLPKRGCALDLACGLGANALLLARNGLETVAWDRASTPIAALRRVAIAEGLRLVAEVRDVVAQPPIPAGFDVIVVSRFLDRGLAPALIVALRPGGLLFYQTFGPALVDPTRGPRHRDFRLAEGELLRLFASLRLRVYREEGGAGDTRDGLRDEVYGIFQR
ncbi:methyltransferase domain-containing protein [Acidihalobacter yilgarnensis]|uniref:methyltransferase domain-containing protein n=1 Tax=Acidihalobacter yilgarnensis TaxID=2819280 RepID=UPI001E355F08|nr:methyltransferase domain-containing protein [Acidihalobacter yilgarnensis]